MACLEVGNLNHSFGDKILYKNAEFKIFKGEHVGLVGQNGTGKSTLLKSLTGEITPDSGSIVWDNNMRVGYLDQHAEINKNFSIFEYLKTAFDYLFQIEIKLNKIYENIDTNMDNITSEKISDYQNLLVNCGFYEIESNILKVSNGIGLVAIGMQNLIKNLSGGQRAKVILAKLLLENPDFLLLDEPTNFLDAEHIEWLIEYLKNLDSAFIIISHDFNFLDKITTRILDIEFQTITKYTGNFEKFLKIKNIKKESYVSEYKAQQKEIKKHEDYISKNRARASTAKSAQSRVKMLDKMNKLEPPQMAPKPRFKLKSLACVSQIKILKVQNLQVGYNKPVLPKINFEMKSGDKIVITGFNGIGKSTLLKTLIGKIPAISGSFEFYEYIKIGYFEQDLNWKDPKLTPIEIVAQYFPRMATQEIRKQLAQCSIMAKHVSQPIENLSGGEQSKVKICILANTPANFLIIDEPTNHLDKESKEVLKTQFENWKNSIILVSHEEDFYKNWTDKIINLNISS
ncbi:MAG: ATP-binding cassette domain-containing protein [Candidatus Improbicoccus devescovinae]|nr:MAG: ATP-binding cassette domain-containing protein [Candidatus Improbicoccus devescovinae]